jgi:hypothetical protein
MQRITGMRSTSTTEHSELINVHRYMTASELAQCVTMAQSVGWNAGIMFWEWTGVSTCAYRLALMADDLPLDRKLHLSWPLSAAKFKATQQR